MILPFSFGVLLGASVGLAAILEYDHFLTSRYATIRSRTTGRFVALSKVIPHHH